MDSDNKPEIRTTTAPDTEVIRLIEENVIGQRVVAFTIQNGDAIIVVENGKGIYVDGEGHFGYISKAETVSEPTLSTETEAIRKEFEAYNGPKVNGNGVIN